MKKKVRNIVLWLAGFLLVLGIIFGVGYLFHCSLRAKSCVELRNEVARYSNYSEQEVAIAIYALAKPYLTATEVRSFAARLGELQKDPIGGTDEYEQLTFDICSAANAVDIPENTRELIRKLYDARVDVGACAWDIYYDPKAIKAELSHEELVQKRREFANLQQDMDDLLAKYDEKTK